MQIDVNVNMTLEVDDDELRAYAEAYSGFDEEEDDLELDPEEFLEEFVADLLDGEEVQTYNGRAWICSVDSCSIMS